MGEGLSKPRPTPGIHLFPKKERLIVGWACVCCSVEGLTKCMSTNHRRIDIGDGNGESQVEAHRSIPAAINFTTRPTTGTVSRMALPHSYGGVCSIGTTDDST